MNKKNEEPVRIKISAEAGNNHRELFGPIKRKEIQIELAYYVTKILETKRTPAQILNYDNVKAVFLEKIEDNVYEVVNFGLASEFCV